MVGWCLCGRLARSTVWVEVRGQPQLSVITFFIVDLSLMNKISSEKIAETAIDAARAHYSIFAILSLTDGEVRESGGFDRGFLWLDVDGSSMPAQYHTTRGMSANHSRRALTRFAWRTFW